MARTQGQEFDLFYQRHISPVPQNFLFYVIGCKFKI